MLDMRQPLPISHNEMSKAKLKLYSKVRNQLLEIFQSYDNNLWSKFRIRYRVNNY